MSESQQHSDPPGTAAGLGKPADLWAEWLRPTLVIVLSILVFRSVVADWNHVPSGSMVPTIQIGDRITVNKLAYDLRVPFTTWRVARWSRPQRGDIVVLLEPGSGRRLIKRVVAVAGDTIAMQDKRLLLDGSPLTYAPADVNSVEATPLDAARYTLEIEAVPSADSVRSHFIRTTPWSEKPADIEPQLVPADHLFVMGDSRDNSTDSRDFGPVPVSSVLGRARSVAFSFDQRRWRRDRCFEMLDASATAAARARP